MRIIVASSVVFKIQVIPAVAYSAVRLLESWSLLLPLISIVVGSASFSTELSVRSPQKLFYLILKKEALLLAGVIFGFLSKRAARRIYYTHTLYTPFIYSMYVYNYIHMWRAARNVKNPPANNYADQNIESN